jgi:hypothetical protein
MTPEEAEAAVARVEALTDPEEMGRAMYRNSGLNEDFILIARAAAAAAVKATLHPPGR